MINQRFAKAREIADVFEALALVGNRNDLPFELTDAIADEDLACIRTMLMRIVAALEPRPTEAQLVAYLKARLANRPHMGLPAVTPAVNPLMYKPKPFGKWKIHRFKAGPRKGKKEFWTMNWQGMALRLNWAMDDVEGKVIFIAYIDDIEVTRGALKSRIEAMLKEEATRRDMARGKPS